MKTPIGTPDGDEDYDEDEEVALSRRVKSLESQSRPPSEISPRPAKRAGLCHVQCRRNKPLAEVSNLQ